MIEAPVAVQSRLDLLNSGREVVLRGVELGAGTGGWRQDREEMVRELVRRGIAVYAIDPRRSNGEVREAGLCRNVEEKLRERSGEKGVMLIGGGHLTMERWGLRGRLARRWDVSSAWIITERSLRGRDLTVWLGVGETGRLGEEFMVDVRGDDLLHSQSAYRLESDWWIYLPGGRGG